MAHGARAFLRYSLGSYGPTMKVAGKESTPTMRPRSWLDSFSHYPTPAGLSRDDLRRNIAIFDQQLQGLWNLGENMLLGWAAEAREVRLLSVPHYVLAEYISGAKPIRGEARPQGFISALISAPNRLSGARFGQVAAKLGVEPASIALPFVPEAELGADLMSALVRRYSISYTKNRPVLLVDIVGFARFDPMEQVVLLQSLSHSLNSAYSKLASQKFRVDFARSTTGDGFYLWNRNQTLEASTDLYRLMLLLLADNAIAQRKSRTRTVPRLRTAFHIGPHYEFYQSEGLSPTLVSYLVGEVTIDLARLIEAAIPGQVLLGDFTADIVNEQGRTLRIGTLDFVEHMRRTVWDLRGIPLAGEGIREIKCYLTGPLQADGTFAVNRYCAVDKHGFRHAVFNAKLNIYCEAGEPIFLGVRGEEIKSLELS